MPRQTRSGGGWPAIRYTLRIAQRVGWWKLWKAMSSRNACKTCALGMGGQAGGMRNERGSWPEVCKKSLQAMAADMQGRIQPQFFERYPIAALRSLTPRELESSGRLVDPLYCGPGESNYRPITWEEAIRLVAAKLRATPPDESFFYFSGRSSNEAGFLLQLLARVYGTNNVNNCSYYCHQASGVGLNGSLGTGTATIVLEDLEHADLVFLIGGNPASNHPRLMTSLMHVRRRGGKVVVINPMVEPGLVNFRVPSSPRSLLFGTRIASTYLQPHIGGDIAVLTGIAKAVLEMGAAEEQFIAQATEGFDEYREMVAATSWEEIEAGGGVSRSELLEVAKIYAASKNVVFSWTMGVTHHQHGVENVQTVVNLALLRGMVGKPHAGLLPIRGHSNVQGIGSVGVTPALKAAVMERLESHFGIHLPKDAGKDTMECMHAADQGKMRVGICLGGNLYGSNPDSTYAARALSNVDLMVYLNTTLNTGHAHGTGKETLILPVLARDEEAQPTTQESMFNYVRLSDGGKPRLQGPKSEVSVIAAVAGQLFDSDGPIDWKKLEQHRDIRQAISRIIPGYENIAEIDKTKKEFQINGRTFHAPRFATPSGKARFHAHPIPPTHVNGGYFKLMTVRSEGQFNTVVYEEEDLYRGMERRDIILLNPEDIERLGLREDMPVTVRSETGVMHGILVRPFNVRAGNAVMYYPEANVLVPTTVDPASRTPAFKSISVTIEAEQPAVHTGGFIPVESLATQR